MKLKRILSIVLSALVLLSCLPMTALATGEITGNEPVVVTAISTMFIQGGTGSASFTIKNNREGEDPITVMVVPTQNTSYGLQGAAEQIVLKKGESTSTTVAIWATESISTQNIQFDVYVNDVKQSEPVTVSYVKQTTDTSNTDTNTTTQGEKLSALVLDSTDLNGQIVAAPSGDAGEKIKIRLPIRNRSASSFASGYSGMVTGAEITPVLSSSLDSFPFEIDELDYKRQLPNLAPGGKAEVVYEFRLSENVTSGVKKVDFNAVYYVDGVAEATTFSVYVTVVKGAAAENTDANGNPTTSVPKVIVKSYKTDPETLVAGETFKLSVDLMNTSDQETVKNLKITLSNGDGVILPANNASNTLYVKSIAKEGTATVEIDLQSSPDAAAKSHSLVVDLDYEGGTTANAYKDTTDISLPITQPIRIKLDTPTIYGDGNLPEQPVSVGFSLFNMGKSAIYNCMVDVEGEGLRMEETYFGGNVASGSTMRADFNIIPSVSGTIDGNIVVTYEDVYGTKYTENLPITVNVMEEYVPDESDYTDEIIDTTVPEQSNGLPWWVFALIGVVAVALLVMGILKIRQAKRRKSLEEE